MSSCGDALSIDSVSLGLTVARQRVPSDGPFQRYSTALRPWRLHRLPCAPLRPCVLPPGCSHCIGVFFICFWVMGAVFVRTAGYLREQTLKCMLVDCLVVQACFRLNFFCNVVTLFSVGSRVQSGGLFVQLACARVCPVMIGLSPCPLLRCHCPSFCL